MFLLAQDASGARIKGPDTVRAGKFVVFHGYGYGAGNKVSVHIQPTSRRGGQGFGIPIRKQFRANPNGYVRLRFRFPAIYYGCSGGTNCNPHRWRRGQRADINAYATTGRYVTGRKVVRVRRAARARRGTARPARLSRRTASKAANKLLDRWYDFYLRHRSTCRAKLRFNVRRCLMTRFLGDHVIRARIRIALYRRGDGNLVARMRYRVIRTDEYCMAIGGSRDECTRLDRRGRAKVILA
jgi:hypothetical protein